MSKATEDSVKKTTEAVRKSTGSEKRNVKARLSQWFRDLKSELKKVVWPTRAQTARNTGITLVLSLVSAVVLWAFDSLADAGVNALIKLVG
ncbi:MAG: preprotein translocase subunit SecE [Oscillospiraceae bacterium]|jgi:preprotein translocase subunit SecE|nr:preprotein translocase subunit SecE [Oscillospiraceae bacterium]